MPGATDVLRQPELNFSFLSLLYFLSYDFTTHSKAHHRFIEHPGFGPEWTSRVSWRKSERESNVKIFPFVQ